MPRMTLLKQKKSMQVYYKQDTHWSNAGSLVGSKTLLQALGVEFGNYDLVPIDKYGGDLVNMSAIDSIKDVDYGRNYRPEIEMTTIYEDDAREKAVTHSNAGNGKNLLLLGDSFRRSMVDVLGKEFENANFYHRSTFTKDNQYADLISNASTIVFQCVARYESDVFGTNGLLQRFIDIYNLL